MKIRKLLFTGLIVLFTIGLLLFPGFSSLIHSSSHKVAAQNIKGTINFNDQDFPNIAPNIREAQRNGAPSVLTRDSDPRRVAQRRGRACRNIGERPEGQNCDEYPFATTEEGGEGARVVLVPKRENSSQGGRLGAFYKSNNIENGDRFRVTTNNCS